MSTNYQHLQPEERITLASLKAQGYSIRSIAQQISRSPSTLSRELVRNGRPSVYASRAEHRAGLGHQGRVFRLDAYGQRHYVDGGVCRCWRQPVGGGQWLAFIA